ncbi:MAG: AcrR family transcriptional regulator [Myxococcota bacterium]
MTASDSESEGLGVGPRVELSRSPSGVRREPRQGRSRELVRAVVEAGQLLLEEADDPESVTTHHIAERAGVDIASLYRYFPNKESIFAEVFEAKLRSDAETVGAHWGTPEELAAQPLDVLFGMLVGRVLDRHVGLFELPPSFDRNHYRDFDLVDRTLGDEGETWEQLLEQRLARLLVANAHRLDVGQADGRCILCDANSASLNSRGDCTRPRALARQWPPRRDGARSLAVFGTRPRTALVRAIVKPIQFDWLRAACRRWKLG